MLAGASNAYPQKVCKDTLFLQATNDEHLSVYYQYYLEPEAYNTPVQVVDSLFLSGNFKHWYKLGYAFNPGLIKSDIWLRVVVHNTLPHTTTFLWSIYNHMDSIYLFKKSGNVFSLANSVSGNSIASKRPFNTRNLALPFMLDANETAVLYLKLIHRAEPIYVVTDITTTEDYLVYEERFWIDSNWYWLLGFFFFAAVFNCILFFFIRDAVHIWYCAYVCFTSVFLLMEDGLDALIFPGWLYHTVWHIDQWNFILLSAACGIGIMQAFIQQKRSGKLYFLGKIILFTDVLFVLIDTIAFPIFSDAQNYTACLWLSNLRIVLAILSLLVTVVSLAVGIIKKNKLAYYYAFAFSFFLFGSGIFFLNNIGISVLHLVNPNALAIGLFWELLSLLFVIILRFRFFIKENSRLRIKELEQQKKAAAQIILAQDEEKHRLAKDLHDDLGNTMGRIQLLLLQMRKTTNINNETTIEMENLVKKAATDIRNISHELMPVGLQEEGLEVSLRKLCEFLSTHSTTAFQFFFSGKENQIPFEVRVVVYRIITELSGNIIKHSGATQAVMQCIIDEKLIRITAEDNGKGMQPGIDITGIGLMNIHNRVQLLNGKVTIDTNGNGTTIIIEIPLMYESKTN